MKASLLVAVVLIAAPLSAQSLGGCDQSGPDTGSTWLGEIKSYSNGLPNGRAWLSFPGPARLNYLLGYMNAIGVARSFMEKKEEEAMLAAYPGNLTAGEIKCGIDRFYAESSNLLVPIPYAVLQLGMQAAGKDTREFVRLARKLGNEAPERHQKDDEKPAASPLRP